jgi:hypothetical protein
MIQNMSQAHVGTVMLVDWAEEWQEEL